MKVYGHPASGCTWKVLATFLEKGHAPRFEVVDITRGEHHTPEHRMRHPFGQVPVLEDGRFRLFESRAIIRYVDAELSGPVLTPTGSQARARMEQWISVECCNLVPPLMELVAPLLWGRDPGAEALRRARSRVEAALDVAEGALAQTRWFVGDAFTLADLSWLPYVQYLFIAGHGALVTARPALAAWWERASTRPSWQQVMAGSGRAPEARS
ncbi:glutathione S-transferase family protein [Corallococcus llansteffanensis]|uniref:glutathione transferase n=1 Tax=Corallococcus llansteffanensis TaxID=2316731 RepID=A0A3A8Q4L1_9BACT|nr:glutathione binding-like protein [Corallococcus llansteffanensis]RKH61890.1 glutathione S-transferase family protein [Corallococcus llansteffanensis]